MFMLFWVSFCVDVREREREREKERERKLNNYPGTEQGHTKHLHQKQALFGLQDIRH